MKPVETVFQSNPDAAGGGASEAPQQSQVETQPPADGAPEGAGGSPKGEGKGAASELSPEMKLRIDFEKRMAQQAFERREANRRAKEAEARAAQAEQRQRELEARISGTPQEPKLEQFDSMAQFIKATAQWEADQRIAEALKRITPQQRQPNEEHELRTREAMAYHAQLDQAVDVLSKVAVEQFPDLKDLPPVELPNFRQTNGVALQAIMESESAPGILNYLIRNPDKAWRLAQSDAAATQREIGRIEALVASAPKNSPGPPAPAERLRGQGGGGTHRKLDELGMDEYTRQREADIRKKRGG